VTIPSSVTRIGDGAFVNINFFTSVTFAAGSAITSENFGDSVTSYPDLKEAYLTGGAGTYTRNPGPWTKQ